MTSAILKPIPLITLITDFGLQDPFAGIMKGVILKIAPKATLVDVTHGIESHNIVEAALILRSSYGYFPRGTIHVVVVDPGVGSERHPILAVTDNYFFIAPDNGAIWAAVSEERNPLFFHLTEREFFLDRVSSTFQGRDIFAPVAAWLSSGIEVERFGDRVSSILPLELPAAQRIASNQWKGTLLRIDKFGNLITNITPGDLCLQVGARPSIRIKLGTHEVVQFRHSYIGAPVGMPFAIWGSAGLLEISVNQASAASLLGVVKNQEFILELV